MTRDAETATSSTSRRSFLSRLLGGTVLAGVGGALSAVVGYLFPPSEVRSALGPRRVKIGGADEIPLGTGRLALVDDEPVWVVHVATGFVALSAWCTHRGCTVKWEPESRTFQCPCHQGQFDEHGNVVAGLPLRPLPRFQVGVVQGQVYASRAGERAA